MANVLKMALIESILSLHAQRWSQRRIARELQIDRETVRKYLQQRLSGAKPATAPTGSGDSKPATFPGSPGPAPKPARNLPTGSSAGLAGESAALAEAGEVVAAPLALAGPLSSCEPYRELIQAKKVQRHLVRRQRGPLLVELGVARIQPLAGVVVDACLKLRLELVSVGVAAVVE